ncbi:MgtC/SapB family protein [Lysobacter sp. GX 14042]|uniref:MgtC/SapB family protein n=1 Tax=Lysobacter sp. GX 14042 TaxID=2907155 RepID=UPI001F29ECF8|nr:MgtC/SapB family protein [Lysobacter sp. GX 14042]MCE7031298.1 MgtC/SapB family protein [Lysobacter sp. GX 14042]
MDWMHQLDTIAATGAAMLLGGVIGFERELRDRPAGFRTHMLVAGAAALLVGLGILLVEAHPALAADGGRLRVDPLRLVESVIAGVAFIGAGSIFARRGEGGGVAGITTAASLLMVAVIGIACGFGYFLLAVLATGLTLMVLGLLKLADRALAQHKAKREPE